MALPASAKVATERCSASEELPSCSSSNGSARPKPPLNYSRQSTDCADFQVDNLCSFEEFLRLDPDSITLEDRRSSSSHTNQAFVSEPAVRPQRLVEQTRFVGVYHNNHEQIDFFATDDVNYTAAPLESGVVSLNWSLPEGARDPTRTITPRALSVSQLTTQAPQSPVPPPARLHPVIHRGFKACLCDAFCPPDRSHEANNPGDTMASDNNCWSSFLNIIPCYKQDRSAQYTIGQTTAASQGYSWQRESRPAIGDVQFKDLQDQVMVKRRGDVQGEQFIIDNCKNCLLLILDTVSSVTIDDCEDCIIIIGPCKGSVFVRDSVRCSLFTSCQQFRTRDCTLMVHLFCSTKPIIEDSKVEFFPLFLRYPFIEENLLESSLPPFTNHWHLIHDFTPETSKTELSDHPKPLSSIYAPSIEWISELKQERVTVSESESFFFYNPSKVEIDNQTEDITVIIYNLQKDATQDQLCMFYQTCWSITRRLIADNNLARMINSHDLVLKEGEMANVLGQKKNKLSGRIVVTAMAGSTGRSRTFIESIVAPTNYPNMTVQVVPKEQTEKYLKAFNRLSDLQSNI
uniref:C-CAP/cofactor C-like domain-containing protein n=1 Tax=Bursaphelenchus xylophilus TaxID=6326 RepID=A0A1I7S3H9_BURXY